MKLKLQKSVVKITGPSKFPVIATTIFHLRVWQLIPTSLAWVHPVCVEASLYVQRVSFETEDLHTTLDMAMG